MEDIFFFFSSFWRWVLNLSVMGFCSMCVLQASSFFLPHLSVFKLIAFFPEKMLCCSVFWWLEDFKCRILNFRRRQGKGEQQLAGAMANITAAEIAGFSVNALLLIAALAAPKVHSFVVHSQCRFSIFSLQISLSLSLFLSHLSLYTLQDFDLLWRKNASGDLNPLQLARWSCAQLAIHTWCLRVYKIFGKMYKRSCRYSVVTSLSSSSSVNFFSCWDDWSFVLWGLESFAWWATAGLWNVEECECCALSAKDMVK